MLHLHTAKEAIIEAKSQKLSCAAGRGQAHAPAAPATAPQLDLSALQSLMTSLGQQPPPPPPPPQAATAQQAYPQGGAGVRQAPGQHCMRPQKFKNE